MFPLMRNDNKYQSLWSKNGNVLEASSHDEWHGWHQDDDKQMNIDAIGFIALALSSFSEVTQLVFTNYVQSAVCSWVKEAGLKK